MSNLSFFDNPNTQKPGVPGGGTILFVHGAGGGAWQWEAAAKLLSDGYRVAALDLSGHGKAPKRTEEHTLETYVGDVLEAIRELGGGPVALCGHSMGGAVAMRTCFDHPEAVGALILANSGSRLRVLPALFDALAMDYPAAVKMMSLFAFGPDTKQELFDVYASHLLEADPAVVTRDFRICDAFDAMSRIGEIRCPTLIIACENDRLTPVKYANWLHENIPGSRLRVFPARGHSAMMEIPEQFADEVRDFLLDLPNF